MKRFIKKYNHEKTNIGFKAGIILDKLGKTRLITIAELARKLNLSADETALAAR